MIVAMAENRVIGRDNELIWHIPEDLKRFKTLTMGKPVIMGRKTFDSIMARLGKPLPGRVNIVISRKNPQYTGALTCQNLDEALDQARKTGSDEIFIIGGAQIYAQAMNEHLADRLYVTHVVGQPEGDAFFPELDMKMWAEESREDHGTYSFVTLSRRPST
ncbi:MAG: dihydrofolate reductase [Alphaproteobacteria bacterium]|nr:dihydrofolate reductase [Alphaproteobacteria bacterium]